MAESRQSMPSEIMELIGAIVLSTQDAEKYMKAVLPFTDAVDPSFSGALGRLDKLQKRTFGELMGKFLDTFKTDPNEFTVHLAALVNQRNQIVHHFRDTYGQKLRSGGYENVIADLRKQLINVQAFQEMLAQLALSLFEAMRDTTFKDTPEYQDMAEFCAAFRQRVKR